MEVSENDYFCRNCGLALRSRPEDTSVPKQILIYFVSFFLAPFGLGFAFSYLRQSDKKAKIIGAVSLALTILAIVAVIVIAVIYTKQEYSSINLITGGGL
ncbi:MAG: hypothetical protein M1155_01760 [Patescibacteria group bacterium]|nr:hypothetical protein [Patescibacteria group bacterium]